MLHPCWPAALCLLLAAHPGAALARSAQSVLPATAAVRFIRGQLNYDGKSASYVMPGGATRGLGEVKALVPYQAIDAKDAIVVTALITADGRPLTVTTLIFKGGPAAGFQQLGAVSDWLPICIRPPLLVLSPLPDPLTGLSPVQLCWHGEFVPPGPKLASPSPFKRPTAFLQPAADDPSAAWNHSLVLIVEADGDDPALPFSQGSRLQLYDLVDGQRLRTLPLGLVSAAGDVELLAQTEKHALLLVQYGFESYEFLAINLRPCAVAARWQLTGQPLTHTIYPGPAYDYEGLKRVGEKVTLLVHSQASANRFERWSFDLSTTKLSKSAYKGPLPRSTDALNAADAHRGAVPYPQSILPSASAPPWNIPALVDGQDKVLVVYEDGTPDWLSVHPT